MSSAAVYEADRSLAVAAIVFIILLCIWMTAMMRGIDYAAPMPGLQFRQTIAVTEDAAGHAASWRQEQIATRFQQGVAMLHAKQYEHAMTAFHRVLELSPRLPEAQVNMGYALLGLQQHKAAADFFSSAIELRPYQANAYWGLAVALEAMGDLPGALGAMRTYIHLAPPAEAERVRKARAAMWEWDYALKRGPLPEAEAEWLARRGREWTERNSPATDMPAGHGRQIEVTP